MQVYNFLYNNVAFKITFKEDHHTTAQRCKNENFVAFASKKLLSCK